MLIDEIDLARRLGRIEAKVDMLVKGRSEASDLEKRVRVLEVSRARLVGMAAGISGCVSVLLSYLPSIIGKH